MVDNGELAQVEDEPEITVTASCPYRLLRRRGGSESRSDCI